MIKSINEAQGLCVCVQPRIVQTKDKDIGLEQEAAFTTNESA